MQGSEAFHSDWYSNVQLNASFRSLCASDSEDGDEVESRLRNLPGAAPHADPEHNTAPARKPADYANASVYTPQKEADHVSANPSSEAVPRPAEAKANQNLWTALRSAPDYERPQPAQGWLQSLRQRKLPDHKIMATKPDGASGSDTRTSPLWHGLEYPWQPGTQPQIAPNPPYTQGDISTTPLSPSHECTYPQTPEKQRYPASIARSGAATQAKATRPDTPAADAVAKYSHGKLTTESRTRFCMGFTQCRVHRSFYKVHRAQFIALF